MEYRFFNWKVRVSMDALEIVSVIIIILIIGGCICDWVLFGTVKQIRSKGSSEREEAFTQPKDESVSVNCPNCRAEASYSSSILETYGRVRCKECGREIALER